MDEEKGGASAGVEVVETDTSGSAERGRTNCALLTNTGEGFYNK